MNSYEHCTTQHARIYPVGTGMARQQPGHTGRKRLAHRLFDARCRATWRWLATQRDHRTVVRPSRQRRDRSITPAVATHARRPLDGMGFPALVAVCSRPVECGSSSDAVVAHRARRSGGTNLGNPTGTVVRGVSGRTRMDSAYRHIGAETTPTCRRGLCYALVPVPSKQRCSTPLARSLAFAARTGWRMFTHHHSETTWCHGCRRTPDSHPAPQATPRCSG